MHIPSKSVGSLDTPRKWLSYAKNLSNEAVGQSPTVGLYAQLIELMEYKG